MRIPTFRVSIRYSDTYHFLQTIAIRPKLFQSFKSSWVIIAKKTGVISGLVCKSEVSQPTSASASASIFLALYLCVPALFLTTKGVYNEKQRSKKMEELQRAVHDSRFTRPLTLNESLYAPIYARNDTVDALRKGENWKGQNRRRRGKGKGEEAVVTIKKKNGKKAKVNKGSKKEQTEDKEECSSREEKEEEQSAHKSSEEKSSAENSSEEKSSAENSSEERSVYDLDEEISEEENKKSDESDEQMPRVNRNDTEEAKSNAAEAKMAFRILVRSEERRKKMQQKKGGGKREAAAEETEREKAATAEKEEKRKKEIVEWSMRKLGSADNFVEWLDLSRNVCFMDVLEHLYEEENAAKK